MALLSKCATKINVVMFKQIQEYLLFNIKLINISVCNLVRMATMQIMEFISVNLAQIIVKHVQIKVHFA